MCQIKEHNPEIESMEEYNDREFPLYEIPDPVFTNRIDELNWKLHKIAANKNWKPDEIANKLGFVCPDCNGYRNLRVFPGEKQCVCPDTIEGAKEWWKQRNDLVLAVMAKGDYEINFMCNECHKENLFWGQLSKETVTCNYCNHTQPQ